uniref:Ovule protein n=1 Tax=Anisakis simplex TaxID=6269 RepID=A0A0M3J545_ANISI
LSLNEAFMYDTTPATHPVPLPQFMPISHPSPKQLKKWHKKHKKLLKKMSSMPPPILTPHLPPNLQPYSRAYSMDNLNRLLLHQFILHDFCRIAFQISFVHYALEPQLFCSDSFLLGHL